MPMVGMAVLGGHAGNGVIDAGFIRAGVAVPRCGGPPAWVPQLSSVLIGESVV